MSDISERIMERIKQKKFSYGELSQITGIPKSALQRYATGETPKIPIPRVEAIANALGVSAAWIMGWEERTDSKLIPPGFDPMPKMVKKPRLGAISCGVPIVSEENFEGYDDIPEIFSGCDFTLKCEGDSMIGARINDGDIVFIKQQPIVENGQIAAVLIDGSEKLLKRVYITDETIVLQAENPKYNPLTFIREDMNRVTILGKAIGFTSAIQ